MSMKRWRLLLSKSLNWTNDRSVLRIVSDQYDRGALHHALMAVNPSPDRGIS
jgi:hypothetical protein